MDLPVDAHVRTTTCPASGCGWRSTARSPRRRTRPRRRRSSRSSPTATASRPPRCATCSPSPRSGSAAGRWAWPRSRWPATDPDRPGRAARLRQLRLRRLHPKAQYKAAAKLVTVPRPVEGGRIGGAPLRDVALLDWCAPLITDAARTGRRREVTHAQAGSSTIPMPAAAHPAARRGRVLVGERDKAPNRTHRSPARCAGPAAAIPAVGRAAVSMLCAAAGRVRGRRRDRLRRRRGADRRVERHLWVLPSTGSLARGSTGRRASSTPCCSAGCAWRSRCWSTRRGSPRRWAGCRRWRRSPGGGAVPAGAVGGRGRDRRRVHRLRDRGAGVARGSPRSMA